MKKDEKKQVPKKSSNIVDFDILNSLSSILDIFDFPVNEEQITDEEEKPERNDDGGSDDTRNERITVNVFGREYKPKLKSKKSSSTPPEKKPNGGNEPGNTE